MRNELNGEGKKKRKSVNLEQLFNIKRNNIPYIEKDEKLEIKAFSDKSTVGKFTSRKSEQTPQNELPINETPTNKLSKILAKSPQISKEESVNTPNIRHNGVAFISEEETNKSKTPSFRSSSASSTFSVNSVFKNQEDSLIPTNSYSPTLLFPKPNSITKFKTHPRPKLNLKAKTLPKPKKMLTLSALKPTSAFPQSIHINIKQSSSTITPSNITSRTPTKIIPIMPPFNARNTQITTIPTCASRNNTAQLTQESHLTQNSTMSGQMRPCKFRLGSSGDRHSSSPPKITMKDIHKIKLVELIGNLHSICIIHFILIFNYL